MSYSSEILRVENLKKSYDGTEALKGVSFELFEGEILGYLGPNGAGKTTTLNIIGGVISKTGGAIYYKGREIDPETDIEFKKRVAYLPENASIYEHFTVKEVIEFYSDIYELGVKRKETAYNLLKVFGLEGYIDTQIYSFSKGMKQKLLFILTLMPEPEILLLDEPFASMDTNSIIIAREMIKELRRRGKSILFSSHILEVIEKICDRVVILDKGVIIAKGQIEEIKRQKGLEAFFTELTGKEEIDERIKHAIDNL